MSTVAPINVSKAVWLACSQKKSCFFIFCSLPFGLYVILNYLIYHSTNYHKSFEDYQLFNDSYVESFLTALLKQEGVYVYVAKVLPFMKIKTDEGR